MPSETDHLLRGVNGELPEATEPYSVNTTVLMPMPSASVATAITVNPGAPASLRKIWRRPMANSLQLTTQYFSAAIQEVRALQISEG
ncbi:MAG TPA: hypothetical protein VN736_00210 [Candidatus Limnocylindrales bacterium]|nr:hypothetical protein [Candidatus Limnocylindrales bacterium]